MLNWFKDKIFRLDEVFTEFPKVYWLTWFYTVIVCASTIAYSPVLELIYNFKPFGPPIFQELIQSNLHVLRWGQIIIPLVISLFFLLDLADLYEKKYFQKYKQYPC